MITIRYIATNGHFLQGVPTNDGQPFLIDDSDALQLGCVLESGLYEVLEGPALDTGEHEETHVMTDFTFSLKPESTETPPLA